MYNVHFPGLGINVKIDPVAFRLGNFEIKWYGIIIAVGFLLAFLYVMKSCRKFNMNQDKFIDCVIVGIIGGIIGARLYYVIFSTSSEFVNNPVSIFYIRQGGLGIYGGIIGGLLCAWLIAKLHKISVPAVFDLASLGFLIGQAIGRWGNFVNQEAFGSKTNLPWRMVSENTELIVSGGVHPCFLYESLWCVIGFILLHIFSRKFRRYDGQTFLLYLLWYGVGRFFIEGFRTDSLITPVVPLRVSQVVAAATVVVSIVLMIVFRKRTSLTGCGLPKIMELNSIVIEVPKKKTVVETIDDDGASTIFENAEDMKKAETGNSTEEDSGESSLDSADDSDNVSQPAEEPVQEEETSSEDKA